MYVLCLLSVAVTIACAHEDGEKAFFALNTPAFQPMARQWMPSLNSMGFEDDEFRFRNFAGNDDFGGFNRGFFNDDLFQNDFSDDLRFGFDDDRLRALASYRTSFRNPILPQGQPVARRISVPFRGYYGDDVGDDMETFYMMNGGFHPFIGGAAFRRPIGPAGAMINVQMSNVFSPHMAGAIHPAMGAIRPPLPSPFMMGPFMMRGPGMMMPPPMMLPQGPMNPAALAFGKHYSYYFVFLLHKV